jgi:hypothetical protein
MQQAMANKPPTQTTPTLMKKEASMFSPFLEMNKLTLLGKH